MKTEDGKVYTHQGKRMKRSYDMYVEGLFRMSIVIFEKVNEAARAYKEAHGLKETDPIPKEDSAALVQGVFNQKRSYFEKDAEDDLEKNYAVAQSEVIAKKVIARFGLYTACEAWLFARSYFAQQDIKTQATGGRENIPFVWRALDAYIHEKYADTMEKVARSYVKEPGTLNVVDLDALPKDAEMGNMPPMPDLPKTADLQANKDAAEARRFGPPKIVIPATEAEADALIAKAKEAQDADVRGPAT